jgi:hypothetical protein
MIVKRYVRNVAMSNERIAWERAIADRIEVIKMVVPLTPYSRAKNCLGETGM